MSLADIYLRAGQQQAQTALSLADIAAQAQQAKAQNWGRAFATIGDIAGNLPQQIQRSKALELQQQELEQRQQATKQAALDQQTVNQIISGFQTNPDGTRTIDRAKLQQAFAQANVPMELQAQTFGTLDKIDGSIALFNQARIEHGADFANSLLTHAPEVLDSPELMATSIGLAQANGYVDSSFLDTYNKALAAGLTPKQLLEHVRGMSDKYKGKEPSFVSLSPNAGVLNQATGEVVREPTQPAPTTPSFQSKDVLVNGKRTIVNFNPKDGKMYDPSTGAEVTGATPIPPTSTTVPVVIQTANGPQLLDRRTGKVSDITDASGQSVEAAPTADMRNKQAGRALVGKSIQAIEDLSKQIITRVGPAQRAEAIKRGADAVFGNDPQFRTYQDARMALAGNLAVAQQGSRPSDADIKAIWLPLVPDAYRDTAESASMKWDLIRKMSGQDGAQKQTDAPAARALASQPPGDYDLSDGHTYRKALDGSVSQVK